MDHFDRILAQKGAVAFYNNPSALEDHRLKGRISFQLEAYFLFRTTHELKKIESAKKGSFLGLGGRPDFKKMVEKLKKMLPVFRHFGLQNPDLKAELSNQVRSIQTQVEAFAFNKKEKLTWSDRVAQLNKAIKINKAIKKAGLSG